MIYLSLLLSPQADPCVLFSVVNIPWSGQCNASFCLQGSHWKLATKDNSKQQKYFSKPAETKSELGSRQPNFQLDTDYRGLKDVNNNFHLFEVKICCYCLLILRWEGKEIAQILLVAVLRKYCGEYAAERRKLWARHNALWADIACTVSGQSQYFPFLISFLLIFLEKEKVQAASQTMCYSSRWSVCLYYLQAIYLCLQQIPGLSVVAFLNERTWVFLLSLRKSTWQGYWFWSMSSLPSIPTCLANTVIVQHKRSIYPVPKQN